MVEAASREQLEAGGGVKHAFISSRWVGEGDARLDATSYQREYYEALRVLGASGYDLRPLSALVRRVYHPTESQPRSNFKRIWAAPGEGPPFLTGRQLFFFRPDRDRFLSPRMKKLHELQIPEGSILISRSGTTGAPVIVGKWLSKFAVTDDALRVFPGSAPIGFVYAYLSSGLGRALMAKSEYGSTVSHLEAKHVADIPVPELPRGIQLAADAAIKSATVIRDRAEDLLDDAERWLHEILGLSPFEDDDIEYLGQAGEPRAFTVRSTMLADRFDATHQVPIARSAVKKLRGGKWPVVPLVERVERVYVAPRFPRIYVEPAYGIPFLQGSHVPMLRPIGIKYLSLAKTQQIAKWVIRDGWVLVTCSGTIGRVAIATKGQDGWAASQHILRIVVRKDVSDPGFLAAYLSTPFGQHQLKSRIYGGVVDELTEDDTESVLIPDVPYSLQVEIGALVREAYELRDEANRIEDEAIRTVDTAIRNPRSVLRVAERSQTYGDRS